MIKEMICLDRPTFTYSGCTYQLNEADRELGKSIITIVDFAIYRPTKQILPLVKDQSDACGDAKRGRIYFSHWDNLKPIPLGQIELFGYSNADVKSAGENTLSRELYPNEPPEPFELDDTLKLAFVWSREYKKTRASAFSTIWLKTLLQVNQKFLSFWIKTLLGVDLNSSIWLSAIKGQR